MKPGLISLPMYNWPELRSAHDHLFDRLRQALGDAGFAVSDQFSHPTDLHRHWRDPDLLLSQTCGLPYQTLKTHGVQIVGTPVYLIDCPPGYYTSNIVIRKGSGIAGSGDLKDRVFAYNDRHSQSGWAALLYALALGGDGCPDFQRSLETGSHRASLQAVSEGRADFAAIDCVTYAHAVQYEPATENLQILMQTPATPGLPLITAMRDTSQLSRLQGAVEVALINLDPAVKEALLLNGFKRFSSEKYNVIAERLDFAMGKFEYIREVS